jgi:hypothetical protein
VESSSSWREDWECLVNAFVRVTLGSWTVRSVRVLWPIKWVCDLCNRRIVACLCKFSQDTDRLTAAAFSRTPCVRTVHLLPLDILH